MNRVRCDLEVSGDIQLRIVVVYVVVVVVAVVVVVVVVKEVVVGISGIEESGRCEIGSH